jgi:small nuclear ribonucleoprotein D3
VTGRDGRVSQLDQVYIRGSMVRFFIVPDMLQNAPMQVASLSIFCLGLILACYRFKRIGPNAMRGRGIGTARGRATISRGTFLFIFCAAAYLLQLPCSKWYVSCRGVCYVLTSSL